MSIHDAKLEGIHTSLVTPLEADRQTVNVEAQKELIDQVVAGGCSGVVVLGGTGEFTALAPEQRSRAIKSAVNHVNGRVPVTVGIVAPGLGDAQAAARMAEDHGADYIMPITPYYVRPAQSGIRSWYLALAEVTNLPIILYNIPARTGVNLEPETVRQLCQESDQIVGIKECSVDLGQFNTLIELVGDRITVMAGEDLYALQEFVLGARGAILATSNVIPREWVELLALVRQNDVAAATRIHKSIFPFVEAIFAAQHPAPLKAALTFAGIDAGPVARPLNDPSPETINRLQEAFASLRAVAR